MPCTYTGSLDGDHILSLEESNNKLSEQVGQLAAELDRVTALLCQACYILERDGEGIIEDAELGQWYQEHKERDKKRKKLDKKDALRAIRSRLMRQLTKRELKALGIKR